MQHAVWLAVFGLVYAHAPHEHGKHEVFEHQQGQIKEKLSQERDMSNKTNMTEEEIAFYYFHLHDRDNNTKLDGLEIMKAIVDVHEEENMEPPKNKEMEDLIDLVLTDHDLNMDGFIDYPEYLRAQEVEKKRDEERERTKGHHRG